MRPAKKPMKAPFVVTVSAVAAVASLVAGCGGRVPGGEETLFGNPPGPPEPPVTITSSTTCTTSTHVGDICAEGETVCAPTPAFSYVCKDGRWGNNLIGNPPLPENPCPVEQPFAGTACEMAPASKFQQCFYDDLCPARPPSQPATRMFACIEGTWVRTSNSYRAPCPTAPPPQGSACGPCVADIRAECTYNTSNGCPPVIAACDPKTSTWNVAISSCNPPPPPADAGVPDP